MNPLQIASLTTTLAPVALRSISKLADAFNLDGGSSKSDAVAQATSQTTNTDSADSDQSGSFSQLYKKLESKIQSLLSQVPGWNQTANSLNVAVDSDGRLSLQSEDDIDLDSLQQWLNSNHELTDLAEETFRSRQSQAWKLGLAANQSQSELNLRFESQPS